MKHDPIPGWTKSAGGFYRIRWIGIENNRITTYLGEVDHAVFQNALRSDGCADYNTVWNGLKTQPERSLSGMINPTNPSIVNGRLVFVAWMPVPGLLGDGFLNLSTEEKVARITEIRNNGQRVYPRTTSDEVWARYLRAPQIVSVTPIPSTEPTPGPRRPPRLVIHQDWQAGLGEDAETARAELARRAWEATKSIIPK